jgi:hypothetical protein
VEVVYLKSSVASSNEERLAAGISTIGLQTKRISGAQRKRLIRERKMKEGTWTEKKPPIKTPSSEDKGTVGSSGGVKRPHYLQLLSATFLVLRTTQHNIGLQVNCSLICHTLINLECCRQIFEKPSKIKFHENLSSVSRGAPCGHRDGRTDLRNEADSRFRSFEIKSISYNVNKDMYVGNVRTHVYC